MRNTGPIICAYSDFASFRLRRQNANMIAMSTHEIVAALAMNSPLSLTLQLLF
jgi:hypothetical protein